MIPIPTLDDLVARRVNAPPERLAADAYLAGFVDGSQAERAGQPLERIACMECGKPVSSPVPSPTIVQAYVVCPECLAKDATE